MWNDEILEEIYRIREEHAKSFNYDLKAILGHLAINIEENKAQKDS